MDTFNMKRGYVRSTWQPGDLKQNLQRTKNRHRSWRSLREVKYGEKNESFRQMFEASNHPLMRDRGVSSELRISKTLSFLEKLPHKFPSFDSSTIQERPDFIAAGNALFCLMDEKKEQITRNDFLLGHRSIYTFLLSLMIISPPDYDESSGCLSTSLNTSLTALEAELVASYGVGERAMNEPISDVLTLFRSLLSRGNNVLAKLVYLNRIVGCSSRALDRMYERYYTFPNVQDKKSFFLEFFDHYWSKISQSDDITERTGAVSLDKQIPRKPFFFRSKGGISPIFLISATSEGILWFGIESYGILTTTEFNLCQTVLNRTLVSSIYVPLSMRSNGEDITAVEFLDIVVDLWESLLREGKKLYSVLHDLEGFVMASVVRDYDEPKDSTYFLKMISSFQDVAPDEWSGDILKFKWIQWILSLKLHSRLNMTGILKLTANPTLSLHAADLKKLYHLNSDQTLNSHYLSLGASSFKSMFVAGYIDRFGRWPSITLREGHEGEEQQFCYENTLLPWNIKFLLHFKKTDPPGLSWWEPIQLAKSMEFNPYRVPHLFTEDKRISADPMWEVEKIKGYKIPPGSESLIIQALKRDSVSGLGYLREQATVWKAKAKNEPLTSDEGKLLVFLCLECNEYKDSPCSLDEHENREVWISRMVNKSTERKIVARIYIENNFKQRVVNTMVENNVRSIYGMMRGGTGLDSESEKMDKLNADAWLTTVQGNFNILIINTDFKQWNAKFSKESMEAIMSLIADIFGIEELEFIMEQFDKNVHVHYDLDGVNIMRGQRGGHEGQLQVTWGIITLCWVEVLKELLHCRALTHQSGDNLVLMLIFEKESTPGPESPLYLEWKQLILSAVDLVFRCFGQEVKTSETIVGRKVFVYLKKCMLAPYQIARAMKSIVSLHGRAESLIQGVIQMRSNQLSVLESAIRESANPLPEYMTSLIMFPIMCFCDFKQFYDRTLPDHWPILMIGGAQLMGVPALHFSQCCCKGMSDYTPIDFHVLAVLSKRKPLYEPVVKNIFSLIIRGDIKTASLSIMQNEFFLPLCRPVDPNSLLKNWMLQRLSLVPLSSFSKDILNSHDVEGARALAMALLDKSANPDIRLAQQLYKCSLYQSIDQLVARFQTTRSIRDVASCSTLSSERNFRTIGQLCSVINKSVAGYEQWITNRLRGNVVPVLGEHTYKVGIDDVLSCAPTVVSNIREHVLGFSCPEVHESFLCCHLVSYDSDMSWSRQGVKQVYTSRLDVRSGKKDERFLSPNYPESVRKPVETITTDTKLRKSVVYSMQSKPALKAAIDLSVAIHWAECGGGNADSAGKKILKHWTSIDLLADISVYQSITVHTRDHRMPSNNRVRENRIICIPASSTAVTVFAQPIEDLSRQSANMSGNYGYHLIYLQTIETLRCVWIPAFFNKLIPGNMRNRTYCRVKCPKGRCFNPTIDKRVIYSEEMFRKVPDIRPIQHEDFFIQRGDLETIRKTATEVYKLDQGVLLSNQQISMIIGLAESRDPEYLLTLAETAKESVFLASQLAADKISSDLPNLGDFREITAMDIEERSVVFDAKGRIEKTLAKYDCILLSVDPEVFWAALIDKFYHRLLMKMLFEGFFENEHTAAAMIALIPKAHIPLIPVIHSLIKFDRLGELVKIMEEKWGVVVESIHRDDTDRLARQLIFGSPRFLYFCVSGIRAITTVCYMFPLTEDEARARKEFDRQVYSDLFSLITFHTNIIIMKQYPIDEHMILGAARTSIWQGISEKEPTYSSISMRMLISLVACFSFAIDIQIPIDKTQQLRLFSSPIEWNPLDNISRENISKSLESLILDPGKQQANTARELFLTRLREYHLDSEFEILRLLVDAKKFFVDRLITLLEQSYSSLSSFITRKIYFGDFAAVAAHMKNFERWMVLNKLKAYDTIDKMAEGISSTSSEGDVNLEDMLSYVLDSIQIGPAIVDMNFDSVQSPFDIDMEVESRETSIKPEVLWDMRQVYTSIGNEFIAWSIPLPAKVDLDSTVSDMDFITKDNIESWIPESLGRFFSREDKHRDENEDFLRVFQRHNPYQWMFFGSGQSRDVIWLGEFLCLLSGVASSLDESQFGTLLYLGADTSSEINYVTGLMSFLTVDYHKHSTAKQDPSSASAFASDSKRAGMRITSHESQESAQERKKLQETGDYKAFAKYLITKSRSASATSSLHSTHGDMTNIDDVLVFRNNIEINYSISQEVKAIVNGITLKWMMTDDKFQNEQLNFLELTAPMYSCRHAINDQTLILQPVRRPWLASSLFALSLYAKVFSDVHLIKTRSQEILRRGFCIVCRSVRSKQILNTCVAFIDDVLMNRDLFKTGVAKETMICASQSGMLSAISMLTALKLEEKLHSLDPVFSLSEKEKILKDINSRDRFVLKRMNATFMPRPDIIVHLRRLLREDPGIVHVVEDKRWSLSKNLTNIARMLEKYSREVWAGLYTIIMMRRHPLASKEEEFIDLFPLRRKRDYYQADDEHKERIKKLQEQVGGDPTVSGPLYEVFFNLGRCILSSAVSRTIIAIIREQGPSMKRMNYLKIDPDEVSKKFVFYMYEVISGVAKELLTVDVGFYPDIGEVHYSWMNTTPESIKLSLYKLKIEYSGMVYYADAELENAKRVLFSLPGYGIWLQQAKRRNNEVVKFSRTLPTDTTRMFAALQKGPNWLRMKDDKIKSYMKRLEGRPSVMKKIEQWEFMKELFPEGPFGPEGNLNDQEIIHELGEI